MSKFQKFSKATVHDQIKERVLFLLETKASVPWRRTWKTSNIRPHNFITGKPYSGFNVVWGKMYEDLTGEIPVFAGYKQIQDSKNGNVIAGTKVRHRVIFASWKPYTEIDRNGNEIERVRPIFQSHNVFHPSQCEGFEDVKQKLAEIVEANKQNTNFNPIEAAEKIIQKCTDMGAVIERRKNTNAYYIPEKGIIVVPMPENFERDVFNYRTTFHELGHWAEDKISKKGLAKTNYEKELFAELFAQSCMDISGIDDTEVLEISKDYIQGFATFIKKSPSDMLYTIIEKVQKTIDVLGLDGENVPTEIEETEAAEQMEA